MIGPLKIVIDVLLYYLPKVHFVQCSRNYALAVDNQCSPYIWLSHCKDSQNWTLKLAVILSQIVNFKLNFHKVIYIFLDFSFVNAVEMFEDAVINIRIVILYSWLLKN